VIDDDDATLDFTYVIELNSCNILLIY